MLRMVTETIMNGRAFRGRGRLVRKLLDWQGGRYVRSRYGPLLRVKPGDLTNYFCISGLYDVDYDDVYAEVDALEAGMAFIDIGANLGLFSMIASRRVGDGGVVIAFEPSLPVFRDLVDNATVNGLNNFFPFNAAVGTGTSLARFSAGRNRHTGIGHLDAAGESAVLQIGFDELVELFDAILGDRKIVIKIDVEGAEELVVAGMPRFLSSSRVEKIIAEIDPAYLARFGSSADSLYARLADAGLHPQRGLRAARHYNEVFVREAVPSRLQSGQRAAIS